MKDEDEVKFISCEDEKIISWIELVSVSLIFLILLLLLLKYP